MKNALKKENFFVYRFLDADQATIYVGKTKNLTGRIRSTHFSSLGHLPDECYAETQIVVYSQCLSESDMTIQERYLINTLSPKYNDLMNRGDAFGFKINCFDWQYLPFIRPDERAKKPAAKNTARSGLLVSSLPKTTALRQPSDWRSPAWSTSAPSATSTNARASFSTCIRLENCSSHSGGFG